MSEKMYEEGYHYITNADFSGVLIEEMRERNAHLEEMDCKLFLIWSGLIYFHFLILFWNLNRFRCWNGSDWAIRHPWLWVFYMYSR